MQRRVLGTVLGGLVIVSMFVLAGCEEMVEDRPSKKPSAAPLFHEISGDSLFDRWGVYAGRFIPVQAGSQRSTRAAVGSDLAAATAGWDFLRDFYDIEDARQYGSCVVFNLKQKGSDKDLHILDCVGAPIAGNGVQDGHFHAAHICEVPYPHLYLLRAGVISPDTRLLYDDPEFMMYSVSVLDVDLFLPSSQKSISVEAQWLKKAYIYTGPEVNDNITDDDYTEFDFHAAIGSEDLSGPGLLVGFAPIVSDGSLHLTIDNSTTVIEFEDNDSAAHAEYNDRCTNTRRIYLEQGDREIREEAARLEAEGYACVIYVWSGYAGGLSCGKPGGYAIEHNEGATAEIMLTNVFDVTNANYTAVSSNESVAEASVSGVVLTVALREAGTATVEVTAEGDEGTATRTFRVAVYGEDDEPDWLVPPGEPGQPGQPGEALKLGPLVRAPFDSVMLVEEGDAETIDVSAHFYDPEGQALTYAIAVAPPEGIVTAGLAEAAMLTIAPVAAGVAIITVTATDPDDLSARAEIEVTVLP